MSLKVDGISKQYSGTRAVDNLSMHVEPGKALGLLGRNGAGKTTTIRMILGIIAKDGGNISWNGRDIGGTKLRVGYLPEERGLYPKSTVAEQLIYLAVLRGMNRAAAKKSLEHWLEKLGVPEYYNRKVESLSKGNQQKIQLIAAIIHDPELLILDEPFSGLDPVNVETLKNVVIEMINKKKCIVFSSHLMEYVEEFCEDILLLKKGETVLQGNLKGIKRSYGRTNLRLGCENDISCYLKEDGFTLLKASDGNYNVKVDKEELAHGLLKKLVHDGIRLDRFEITEPSLHEIFIEKVGDMQ